jgi:DNA-binding transcriptional LysR family regulator
MVYKEFFHIFVFLPFPLDLHIVPATTVVRPAAPLPGMFLNDITLTKIILIFYYKWVKIQDMNDLQIKYFLGVVDHGCNFTQTAQAFYLSQSALSQHILALGKEFGVKLFDTSNKSQTKLTPGGKILYQFLSEFNSALRVKITEAQKINHMPVGTLKIACCSDWEMLEILQEIDNFRARYPNINISFYSMDYRILCNGLKHNDYDMIISQTLDFKCNTEVNTSVIFADVPTVLIFSVKHKLANKENLHITDFKEDIFYVLDKEERPLARKIHEDFCKGNGFIPQFREYPNLDSIYLALETGAGCTILDKMKRICKNTDYKYFDLDLMIDIGFIWKKANTNPSLQLFLNEMVLCQNNCPACVELPKNEQAYNVLK